MNRHIWRIWQGRKEFADQDYYVGQVQTENGCFKNITNAYRTFAEAEKQVFHWLDWSAAEGRNENA